MDPTTASGDFGIRWPAAAQVLGLAWPGAADLSLAIVAGAAAVLAFDLLKPVPAVARALVPASRERSPP